MIRNRWPIAVLLLLALMIGVSVQAVGGQASYVHTTPPGDSAYAEAAQEETPVIFGKDKGGQLHQPGRTGLWERFAGIPVRLL